ncbi:hypothetical protein PJN21_29040, partial [Mycobacterium kansasii]
MKGEYKDDFKKLLEEQGEDYVDGAEWISFNEPMMDYNVQDVVVTKALLEKLLSDKHYFPPAAGCGDNWWMHDAVTFWQYSCEAVWL